MAETSGTFVTSAADPPKPFVPPGDPAKADKIRANEDAKRHADDLKQKRPAELQDKTNMPQPASSAEADKAAAEDQQKRVNRADVFSDTKTNELSPKDRLEAFLVSLRTQHKHNAPITPALVQELQSIVDAHNGNEKPVATTGPLPHNFLRPILSRKDDGTQVSLITAEDGLKYMQENVKRDPVNETYWAKTEEFLKVAIEDPTPFKLEVAARSLADSIAKDRSRKPADAVAREKVANPLTGFNHPAGVPQNAYGADDL